MNTSVLRSQTNASLLKNKSFDERGSAGLTLILVSLRRPISLPKRSSHSLREPIASLPKFGERRARRLAPNVFRQLVADNVRDLLGLARLPRGARAYRPGTLGATEGSAS
jgi:hypothetical protein